jgi:hypothetical protein
MLEPIFPIPEAEYRICSDAYLLSAAPLAGALCMIAEPQGCYRLHDRNNYWNQPFAEALRRGVETYELQCRTASQMLTRRGIEHDASRWRAHSWWHRLRDAIDDIVSVVPPGRSFLLADDDEWGSPEVFEGGRRRIPFPEHDGHYAGPPPDDDGACAQLQRLRSADSRFLAFAWNASWYLDFYRGLSEWLDRNACRVLSNERVVIFDLLQS